VNEHGSGFIPSTRGFHLPNVDMEFDGVYLDLQSKRSYGTSDGVTVLTVFEFDERGCPISATVIPKSAPMRRALKFFLGP
jgi:hypothetical protein